MKYTRLYAELVALSVLMLGISVGIAQAQAPAVPAPTVQSRGAAISAAAKNAPAQAAPANANADAPGRVVATSQPGRAVLKVVAIVNGEEISRQELIQAALKDYGQETLERIISRNILEMACKKAGVTVTEADLRAEVETTAKRFSLTTDQYFQLLERERGISAAQYVADVVWPSVAVDKLVGNEIRPTEQELKIEYERRYGEAIKGRMIATKTEEEANQLRQEALKDLSKFGELAQKHSTDPYTAGLGGVVPPIRRHMNPENFEKEIFQLKANEISKPIKVGDQFVLILCEERLPADPGVTFDSVKDELTAIISQSKKADAGKQLAKRMMNESKIEICFNDPKKSAANPGVAAKVDGRVISTAVLGEACVERHGKSVLGGLINRKIVEQAAKKQKIEISDKDVDAEIAEQALEQLPPKDGKPDVEQFLKNVCLRLSTTEDRFREDVVRPWLEMKSLAKGKYQVTEEDLQRSYEANFGVKVRCRAIVLNDMRTAQRVWAEAREKGTEESFIELAKKFSVEASSRANGGQVPPIARYGGQPELEKEAFKLADGELSSIIQAGNVYVILLCLGHTEPVGVSFEEAKDVLVKEVTQMKLQEAIGRIFQELNDAATVENYLDGTMRSPQQKKAAEEAAKAAADGAMPSVVPAK